VAVAVAVIVAVGVDDGGSDDGVAVGVGVTLGVAAGVGVILAGRRLIILYAFEAGTAVPSCCNSTVRLYSPGTSVSAFNVITEEGWVG